MRCWPYYHRLVIFSSVTDQNRFLLRICDLVSYYTVKIFRLGSTTRSRGSHNNGYFLRLRNGEPGVRWPRRMETKVTLLWHPGRRALLTGKLAGRYHLHHHQEVPGIDVSFPPFLSCFFSVITHFWQKTKGQKVNFSLCFVFSRYLIRRRPTRIYNGLGTTSEKFSFCTLYFTSQELRHWRLDF